MATVFAGEPIGEWIGSNPSDEELRTRLLRRVRWCLKQAALGPLTEFIRDKIVEMFLARDLLVTAADEGLSVLLDRVFETASSRDQSERRLTSIDLLRSIEHVAIRLAALKNVTRALNVGEFDGVSSGSISVTRLNSMSADTAPRQATVNNILALARGDALIWLHGSHGVGKSTLARLIATQIGGSWLTLDLRPFLNSDGRAALSVWRELVRQSPQDQISGIIIDDLTGPPLDALRPRLAALTASLGPRGARVIVTSAHAPSPARLVELRTSPNASFQAPYFTEEDVRALVVRPGGPPDDAIEAWVRLIWLTTNGGHPLLVAAKVASLRSRGWPASAVPEDVGPLSSDAVRTTRDEARRRLLAEVPSTEGRQLLRRIACAYDRTEDSLILKLAQGEPIIPNASDILAVLRLDTACRATWGGIDAISDVVRAASSGCHVGSDVTASVALAGDLSSKFDPSGQPALRYRRDLLLVYRVSRSSARRALEPLVIEHLSVGWLRVLAEERFALKAPMQYAPIMERALSEMKSLGLRGAAEFLLIAAPAARFSLGEEWRQALERIGGHAQTNDPADGI